MTYDPSLPVPPDSGASHTHAAARVEVTAAQAAPGNEVPVGEWRVLLKLESHGVIQPGHMLAAVLEPARAREIALWLIQAAGDVESGRVGR